MTFSMIVNKQNENSETILVSRMDVRHLLGCLKELTMQSMYIYTYYSMHSEVP